MFLEDAKNIFTSSEFILAISEAIAQRQVSAALVFALCSHCESKISFFHPAHVLKRIMRFCVFTLKTCRQLFLIVLSISLDIDAFWSIAQCVNFSFEISHTRKLEFSPKHNFSTNLQNRVFGRFFYFHKNLPKHSICVVSTTS